MKKYNPSAINSFCLFTAIFQGSAENNIFTILGVWLSYYGNYFNLFPVLIGLILVYFGYFKPLRFMNQIIGIDIVKFFFSIGLGGIKIGHYNISTVTGFTGLKIVLSSRDSLSFYLGFALDIK